MKSLRDTFVILAATVILILILAYTGARAEALNTYVGVVEVIPGEGIGEIEAVILVTDTAEHEIRMEGLGGELSDLDGKRVVVNGSMYKDEDGFILLDVKEYFID